MQSKKRAIVVDIDSTIADVSERAARATKGAGYMSAKWYDLFFDGELANKIDVPIEGSAAALKELAEKYRLKIIYLSGRRDTMLAKTAAWLCRNGYPHGEVVLRPLGRGTIEFKREQALRLTDKYNVVTVVDDEPANLGIFYRAGVDFGVRAAGPKTWRGLVQLLFDQDLIY